MISADAGFGKTRLLQHFLNDEDLCGSRSSFWMSMACGKHELSPVPLTPWKSAVKVCDMSVVTHVHRVGMRVYLLGFFFIPSMDPNPDMSLTVSCVRMLGSTVLMLGFRDFQPKRGTVNVIAT